MNDLGPGAIALAAYEPDAGLYAAQLQSIRAQTVQDFICVIAADSDPAALRALTDRITGGDPRFRVVGDGAHRGFYLNFELALRSIPPEARWVALSDQDDRWDPHKLASLLPQLASFSLVSGQARVTSHPDGGVLVERTRRRVVGFDSLLIQNQITGAQSVFRRELLDVALPFPRVRAVTAVHDHWLALCAAVTGGYTVVDVPLQDYVQHGSNLIGEVEGSAIDIWGAGRRLRELAAQYEGGASLTQVMRVSNRLSFGWRRATLTALSERLPGLPDEAAEAWAAFAPAHRIWPTLRYLVARLRSGEVAPGTVATFLPGIPLELIPSRRLEMSARTSV